MAFLSPFFLLGALAATLPILVHLVRRTRARQMQFPSLMFLRRIEQKTVRRHKLRNLLLLILRCLALLLLALAFSRPYFTGTKTEASSDQPASFILLDRSYSMRFPGVFERARRAALDDVAEASATERLALATFDSASEVLADLKSNRSELGPLIDQAGPGLGATDYTQALQVANATLREAGNGRRRIYLISDFQDSGWNRAGAPFKLSPGIELIPQDVADPDPANLAVLDIKGDSVVYAQKYDGKVSVRVGNLSAVAAETTVDFKINDLVAERRPIKLEPHADQVVDFTGFNLQEGFSKISAEISGDRFPVDNRFFMTIKRQEQNKVLAIETATRDRGESFYLQQSLLAGQNSPYALTVKTAGSINPSDIAGYQIIVVNDASGVSAPLASAIKDFVERGGGLLIVAGKHSDPADFNPTYKGIAPAKLGDVAQTRGGYALLTELKTSHPVLSMFAKTRLASTRVYQYHRSEPLETSSTLAALDDGSPLMIEGRAGTGKVLMLTTSLDSNWSDLPLAPVFLPLIRQTMDYLGGIADLPSYTIGQTFSAALDRDGSAPVVDSPTGGRATLGERQEKDRNAGLAIQATEPGFYQLRYRERTENVAVNLDTRESNLSKLDIQAFVAGLNPTDLAQSVNAVQPDPQSPAEIEGRQRLWLPLIAISLLLFLVEAVIARRIRVSRLLPAR